MSSVRRASFRSIAWSPRSAALLPLLAALLGVFFLPAGCAMAQSPAADPAPPTGQETTDRTENGAGAPALAAQAPARTTPAQALAEDETPDRTADGADEAEIAAKILELSARVPENVRQPGNMTMPELHALVDEILTLGEDYLRRFPEGASRKDVIPPVARLWVVNNTRYFVGYSREYEEQTNQRADHAHMAEVRAQYFERVFALLDEGLRFHPEKGPVNQELLRLLGQASQFGQEYEQSIEAFETLLQRYPEDPRAAENLLALLSVTLSARRYEEATTIADRFLAKYPMDELASHVYQLKAKGLMEGGEIRRCLDWWLESGEIMQKAAAGTPVTIDGEEHVWSPEAQQAFQRYLDERWFMIGYLQGALGDLASARESLEKALLELLEAQKKGTMGQRSQVFLSRTDKVHSAYLNFVGKPVPEMTIDRWLDDVGYDPQQEIGQVQLMLFVPFENPRYTEMLQIAQRLYRDRWSDGLRVVRICGPKGISDLDGSMARVAAERKTLGLSFPIGIDVDPLSKTDKWPTHARFNASSAGGTMVVVDRAGDVAWFKLDPTWRDEKVLGKVLDRLLAEPAPENSGTSVKKSTDE